MAPKNKAVKFRSDAEGPITVYLSGPGSIIRFEPGETRTYETSDPTEIEALRANPDVSEEKGSGK